MIFWRTNLMTHHLLKNWEIELKGENNDLRKKNCDLNLIVSKFIQDSENLEKPIYSKKCVFDKKTNLGHEHNYDKKHEVYKNFFVRVQIWCFKF